MSKTWYPVLNYEKCVECGVCMQKCSHSVYQLDHTRPVVVNPDSCTEGCHGCGSLCPSGAIEYIGDTSKEDCGCNCSHQ